MEIGSFTEFTQRENDIVRLINAAPNGARRFIADPIRLLRDLDINLAAPALRELEATLGQDALAANPLKRFYDDFMRDSADERVKVVIRGIVRKGANDHA